MSNPSTKMTKLMTWAFLAIPIIGACELVAHAVQVNGKVPDADWIAARGEVAAKMKPDDLVAFAPAWSEPLGRHFFGEEIASFERVARPDETRFPRAIEVSIRGQHLEELATWKKVETKRVGKITLTTLENPSPVKILDDLVSHIAAGGVEVTRVDGASEEVCPLAHGTSQSGNVGFGPAIPADRFSCNTRGGFVGITALPDLGYRAHRCIYVPPQGGASVMRLRFKGVKLGRVVHGHHAISVHAERDLTGSPVTLAFRVDDRLLGKLVHHDGDSWKGFELDTSELAGTTVDLIAEVSSPSAANRQYCFEADTR